MHLSFSSKLFISIISLFWLFVACFVYYQYCREKEYRVELLNDRLNFFNIQMHQSLRDERITCDEFIDYYARHANLENLRVTLIDKTGKVIYDNEEKHVSKMANHASREEVKAALESGNGISIKRTSKTKGQVYFYSATYFKENGLIVRSALPYDMELTKLLQADMGYVWFTLMVTVLLSLVFYNLTAHLGSTITQLRKFAQQADLDGPFESNGLSGLHDNELTQISRHIVDIYKRLRSTKDDLYVEREKLISHLQISNVGLAIFNPGKDVILSNSLFMQYMNLLSEKNISSMDDVFEIAELKLLIEFITECRGNYTIRNNNRKSITIDKNGYVFAVETVVFPDLSFEISINDVTEQEEKARMKRQITQNVAHELKTPVSSIQGYLETILNNPNLPSDKLQQFLQRSYTQSNRLTNLLRDINALTRLDDSPDMIELETVDLNRIIHGVCEELALQIEEKQIKVLCTLPETMLIEGNASLLYSIFRNLMDNAIAYAGTEITLKITCFREDDGNYYFSFADNGVGVGNEHLGRIFERFYRVDKGRSRKIGGTGLGLAIVKNAVVFHGGVIHAKRVPTGGLEFVFSIAKTPQS